MASQNSTLSEKSKVVTVTNAKIDAAARDKLVTSRVGLLLRAPFFGNLATRLKLVNADAWCPTAATEGRHFYYNSEFINQLSLKECEFLFGHEVLHVCYDHMGRRGDRDPQLWNIADDYCVNADLIEQRVGEKINKVPILYNQKYQGWSAEEVYDDLYQNADKIDISSLAKQILDEHMDGQGDGEGDGEGDNEKDGNGRPKLTKEEQQAIRDEIKEAMLSAAQAAGAGNVPGGVKRLIKDLTEPTVNWRELLPQQIQSTIKSDYSWARPSRRSWHMDAVLPGLKPEETVDVAVFIDTSGSISDQDLKIFLSEIKGIMDTYTDYKIHIATWDTEVYNPQDFTADSGVDIREYEPGGGGGTDPHCIWNYLIKQDLVPKKLIVFTDFCFYGWNPDEVKDYCDTVWIIKDNPEAKPEFGVWAHYEPSGRK